MDFRRFQKAIVRIMTPDLNPVGLGLVVAADRVLTCAHVVRDALSIPREKRELLQPGEVVDLDFPFVEAPPIKARLEAFDWSPDSAVLVLLDSLPPEIEPVPLRLIDESMWDEDFRAYGVPLEAGGRVRPTDGRLLDGEKGLLQIQAKDTIGFPVERGFSGGPLWNESRQAVVGLIIRAEKDADKRRVAYALSAVVLAKRWPELPWQTLDDALETYLSDLEREAEKHRAPYYVDLRGEQRPMLEQIFIETPYHKEAPPRPFEDAVPELKKIRRAILVGDPGAGKTTTLFKLALDLCQGVRSDPAGRIPILLRLTEWIEPEESLEAFMFRKMGPGIGQRRERLLAENRAAVLFDGLNELPTDPEERENKLDQIRRFIGRHPDLLIIASSRKEDYRGMEPLPLARVEVKPLNPLQIRRYTSRYLDVNMSEGAGEDLFWQLVGKEIRPVYEDFISKFAKQLPDAEKTFWLEEQFDSSRWDFWDGRRMWDWERWLAHRRHPAGLHRLAENPYMLFMLVSVYEGNQGALPANRGTLFDWFVAYLLWREKLARKHGRLIKVTGEGEELLQALTELAFAMQSERERQQVEGGALTTLRLETAKRHLSERQQYLAASANILIVQSTTIRFAHQLLQEYFLARALRARLFGKDKTRDPLDPTKIWPPERWWEPTNWEEAFILLAGFEDVAIGDLVDWLADVQPELAARCLLESGVDCGDEVKLRLQEKWVPRLTALQNEPDPRSRAAVGRALGRIRLEEGSLLDDRPGVGIVKQGTIDLPQIEWGKVIPADKYLLPKDPAAWGGLETRTVEIQEPYQLSIYPITYAQFECFVRAEDFNDDRWWKEMPPDSEIRKIAEQRFPFWNHPREMVSWYQALAFCRWLEDKLDYGVTLPHEDEWEVAARFNDGRVFSFEGDFDPQKANTNEGESIGRTSAVGIYPHGANKNLNLYDLSGNVWEWCRNKFNNPEVDEPDESDDWRVVRGGSWDDAQDGARAASRDFFHPNDRDASSGFRVMRRPPSP